ncbi:MAG TPA: hypothetical protein VGR81_00415 [Candidatus Acidoferrales bacterium]|nr:hypothetical protein [Candidatus Acidoferrales bacterium]
MLDSFVNYFWAHPMAIGAAAIAVIIILVWMTGSGSRQRFIVLKRTKETEQLTRDLGRIAAALEKIAKQHELPTDYVGRPIPTGWEETISAGEPVEEHADSSHAAGAGNSSTPKAPAVTETVAAPVPAAPASANSGGFRNPLGGTADMLGKKKLDLPNPLYRPK